MRIVIDGNIGCGKSTLMQSLKETCLEYKNIQIFEENIDEWKPFLKEFYKNMKDNSLKFQMKVLEHHLHCGILTSNSDNKSIHERSPLSCIEIFGKDLLNSGFLKEIDIDLMKSYNSKLGWTPDLIVYLKSDYNVAYNRCKERSREGEETIPLEYLKNINALYDKLYENSDIVTIIDANRSKDIVLKEVIKVITDYFN